MKRGEDTKMKMSTFNYYIGDAFRSLKRNKTMTIASIATILATLFIFGISLILSLNVNSGVKSVEDKVVIKVYLKKDINISDKNTIQAKLSETKGVRDVTYESKEQALENAKKQFADYKEIFEGYDDPTKNPLPTSYTVKVEKPDDVKNVIDAVKNLSGVESYRNDQQLINSISNFAKTLRWVIIAFVAILAFVSIFLIVNTIKLTVYSRRREIGIMKFVGATDAFIRWPFIIEGMFIGIVGAIISTVVLYFSYKWVYHKIAEAFISFKLVDPSYILYGVSWEFCLAGIAIGVFGSVIALRKFLIV